MPTIILTDSTTYLPPAKMQEFGIQSIPLSVIWGQETYDDGITIQPEAFYARLKTSKVIPSTSQPSAGKFHAAFQALLDQGYDVLGIFISSKISGTCTSAMQARDMLATGKEKVEIVDSQHTTISMGLIALAAARAAKTGSSLAECKEITLQAREKTNIYFMVDTLEFLHRGGRIGGAQRFLGTALNLKPILCLNHGKIDALERIRTKGKALDRLVELVQEQCQGQTTVRLAGAHAINLEDAQTTLAKAAARLNPVETFISELSPVIGTHVGPGTVALACQCGI